MIWIVAPIMAEVSRWSRILPRTVKLCDWAVAKVKRLKIAKKVNLVLMLLSLFDWASVQLFNLNT
jgi:hypothetical protein